MEHSQFLEDQTLSLIEFAKNFLLNRISCMNVKIIELIKKVIRKQQIFTRKNSTESSFLPPSKKSKKDIDDNESNEVSFSDVYQMKNGLKFRFSCSLLRDQKMILLQYHQLEKNYNLEEE